MVITGHGESWEWGMVGRGGYCDKWHYWGTGGGGEWRVMGCRGMPRDAKGCQGRLGRALVSSFLTEIYCNKQVIRVIERTRPIEPTTSPYCTAEYIVL